MQTRTSLTNCLADRHFLRIETGNCRNFRKFPVNLPFRLLERRKTSILSHSFLTRIESQSIVSACLFRWKRSLIQGISRPRPSLHADEPIPKFKIRSRNADSRKT